MLYPPKASVLGFLLRPPARDAVRGFCATFAIKSGKEKGRLGRPQKKIGRCQPPAYGSHGKTLGECTERVCRVVDATLFSFLIPASILWELWEK